MSNGSAAGGGDPQKPTSSISSQDTGEFYKCQEKTMKMHFVFLKCYTSFPISNSYCDIYSWSRGYIFCEL